MDIKNLGTSVLTTATQDPALSGGTVSPMTSGGKDKTDPPVVKTVTSEDIVTLSSGEKEEPSTYEVRALTSGGKDKTDPPVVVNQQ
jgi:hypothetical protein